MSKLDDLRRFDDEWQRHQRWKNGTKNGRTYIDAASGDMKVSLLEMPDAVRYEVKMRLENVIADLVVEVHDEERAKVACAVLEEAQRTIAELTSTPPIPVEPEGDVDGDLARIGSACEEIAKT